jgi:hypothetical protein
MSNGGLAVVAVAAIGLGAFLYSKKSSASGLPPGDASSQQVTGASGTSYLWTDVTQADSPPGQVFFQVDDAEGPIMQYTQLTSDERRIMVQAYVTGPRLETAAADFDVGLV